MRRLRRSRSWTGTVGLLTALVVTMVPTPPTAEAAPGESQVPLFVGDQYLDAD